MPDHPDFDPDAYYGDPEASPTGGGWVAPGPDQPPTPTDASADPTQPFAAAPPPPEPTAPWPTTSAPPADPTVPYGDALGGAPLTPPPAAPPGPGAPPPPYAATGTPPPMYAATPGPGFPGPPSDLGYGYAAMPYPARAVTNPKAVGSLVTGIIAVVLSACCWGGLLGLVAIPLGVVARNEIKRGLGYQQGDGLALAGIITGAIGLAITLLLLVMAFGLGTISTP